MLPQFQTTLWQSGGKLARSRPQIPPQAVSVPHQLFRQQGLTGRYSSKGSITINQQPTIVITDATGEAAMVIFGSFFLTGSTFNPRIIGIMESAS